MADTVITDIADFILQTQKHLGKLSITDNRFALQEYVAVPKIFKKSQIKIDSGTQIQFNYAYRNPNSAAMVTPRQQDNQDLDIDVQTEGSVPWRYVNTHYSINQIEQAHNRQPDKLVDMVKIKRSGALGAWYELVEPQAWSAPASSTNKTDLMGIPYWIVKYSSATGGFLGGNPSGHAAGAAGIDSDTYTRWKNWSCTYTTVTKPDLIRKWREAAVKTRFMNPLPQGERMATYGSDADAWGYFSTYRTIGAMVEVLESQNDNLGSDVAPYGLGSVMFMQRPVTYVPYLEENDTSDPVYGINWSVFKTFVLKDWWMKEHAPRVRDLQHNTLRVDIDNAFNLVCYDRRRNFVLYQA